MGWSEILNKCTFDLMALTIQEVSTNLALVSEEISQVKQTLSNELTDPTQLKQLFGQGEQQNNVLVKETLHPKIRSLIVMLQTMKVGDQWRNPTQTQPKT